MTHSASRTMTSLLLLTSACLAATHAWHVHVHRVSLANDITDTLHSFSLTMRDSHAEASQSVIRTVTLTSGGKRIRRAAGEQTPYKDGQKDKVTIDLKENKLRYGVLLDAGSSSTKVKVYTYTPGILPSLVPHVKLVTSDRLRPGLGDIDLPKLGDYLHNTTDQVKHHIPQELHAVTPVYLMATAGLRTLEVSEAKMLLQEVQRLMANKTINPFFFQPGHVGILSGEEEAVYAWLAVNYLLGFFSSNMTRADSVGILEMGGGSLQVAFLPDGPLYQEEFQVYVGRRRFDLYAQSYLGFGNNYLTQQVRRQLLENLKAAGDARPRHLDSPCMLTGDKAKMRHDDVTVKVEGTGDPAECERVLTHVLEAVGGGSCSPAPCGIRDRYQPAVGSMVFYGISGFFNPPNTLQAIEGDNTLNITKLRRNAWKHCNRTLERAVNESGANPSYASNDCLVGLFIPLLLTRSLGLPENSTAIHLAKDIQEESIDWALGAMLQQLSMAFMDDLESLSVPCPRPDIPVSLVTGQATGGARPLRLSLTFLLPPLLVALAYKKCV